MTIRSTSVLRWLAGLVFALPVFVHADPGFHPGPEGGPPYLRGLQLDETQRDKVFSIMHSQAPQLREQHKVLDKARQALDELVRSGQYTGAKAKPIADNLARATSEIALLRARSDSQILALLTPDQRSRLAQLQQLADDDRMRPPERPPMR